jgi:hypothetical protein
VPFLWRFANSVRQWVPVYDGLLCTLRPPAGFLRNDGVCRAHVGQGVSYNTPDISPILSPIPARIPTTPICPNGFWSNHSAMNSRVYWSIRSKRVGRISRSIIEDDRSSNRTRCRIMVRRIAVDGASSLKTSTACLHKGEEGNIQTFADVRVPSSPPQNPGDYRLHLPAQSPRSAYMMLPMYKRAFAM